ncbi:MAG: hypothetical protein U0800_19705 [Isosphaeraceae bacterium]
MSWILAFIVYWLVLFVACYLVTEYGQAYLYDEVTPYIWPRVAGASFLLAAVLTRAHTSFDTMLTDGIGWTIGQAVLWFLAFLLILRFHPLHAAVLGVVTMVLVVGLATMAVDSLQETIRPTAREKQPVFDPKDKSLLLRKSAAGSPGTAAGKGAEKAQAEPAEKP